MQLQKLVIPAIAVAAGGAVGAGVAAATSTKDESFQTKLSGIVAGTGLVGGAALIRAAGRMPDGGLAAVVLGAAAIGVGAIAGGATLGSFLVDRQN